MPATEGPRHESVRRSREALLTAAAAAFVDHGVQVPVREVATRAGVGLGTVYRHFPTRADLVGAVYHHQVAECVDLAARLRASSSAPVEALERWVGAFVGFLVTKHGLSDALSSDDPAWEGLHALLVDQLVPACAGLLDDCRATGDVDPRVEPFTLLRAVGNLCLLGSGYTDEDARRMVARLLAGCRTSAVPPS